MPNYLHSMQMSYKKAQKELETALSVLEKSMKSPVSPMQSLKVTNGMLELFRDRPIILIQHMDVKVFMVSVHIQNALRSLDKLSGAVYKDRRRDA